MKNSDLNGTRQRVRAIVETTGRYQVILCILLSIHSAIVAFNHTEPAFLNYEPAFRCKVIFIEYSRNQVPTVVY